MDSQREVQTKNLLFKCLFTRIWDIAGQGDYKTLRPLAYTGTDIVIIAFSIVNRDSFNNVKKIWIKEYRKHMKGAKVGTKILYFLYLQMRYQTDFPHWDKKGS